MNLIENGPIRSDMAGVLDIGQVVARLICSKCQSLTDTANKLLDEVWPMLRAEIFQSYLYRKCPTPIVEFSALVHSTPWDWDLSPCERCGKMVGTPVLKKRRAWLGDKYCYVCERIVLTSSPVQQ